MLASSKTPKSLGYILYVDESGDDGFEAVQPIDPSGSSEWMILAGVLVHAHNHIKPVHWVREFKETIKGAQRPDLHFATLKPDQRLAACEHLASKHLRWFAVVSNKRNMRGYHNPRAARHDTRNPFYNWMLRLLLERTSAFCAARTTRDYGETRTMRVELGARGGVSIPRIKVYLWDKLQRQSQAGTTFLKRGSIDWAVMDRNEIEIFQAHRRAGIQLADVVASAIRQAVDLKSDGTLVTEYADALRPVVAATKRGVVADHGFKLMPDPPSLWKIGLSDQQVRLFERFGYGRRYLVGPDP